MPQHRLVERGASLATARARIAELRAGTGGALCLVGPAGAGKTALLNAALEDPGPVRVLRATAGELEAYAPYSVVRQLFGRPLASLPEDALDAIDRGAARPAVDLVLHRAGTVPVDQSAMLNSLYWLLDGLAADGPLVVAVDDAQWADDASLQFLQHLLVRPEDLPVLVVVAAREVLPDRRHPALAAVLADPRAVRLDLAALSHDGVRACLADRWGVEADDSLAAACAEVTGGNPFLVVAVGELLAERSAPTTGDAVRTLVPGSVVDTVVRRLTALPAAEQTLARALAVLETAPLRTAAALAGLDVGAAAEAADGLREAGLLAAQAPLAFQHALLRGAVETATAPAARDQLHRRAARILSTEDLHLAVGHLLQVEGIGDRWSVELLRTAARAALAEGAPRIAVDLLRRAVAEPPEQDELPRVLVELGTAELHAADPGAVTTLERAGRDVTDPVLRAQCALALGAAYHVAGFYDRTLPLLQDVLEGLGPEHGDLRLVTEAALIAAAATLPGAVGPARARLAAHGELAGDTPGERLLLIQQASVADASPAPVAAAGELARRAIGDGLTPEQLASPYDWTIARIHLACSGEYDATAELCARGLEHAAREGSVPLFAAAAVTRGWAHLWAGRVDDSEADFAAALGQADLVPGGEGLRLFALAGRAEALLAQGRVAEAATAVDAVPEEVARDPANATGIHLLRARGLVRAAAGRHESALDSLEACAARLAALEQEAPTWCDWRTPVAESLWALGRVEEAADVARTALDLAERKSAPSLLGHALRVAGEIAGAEGIDDLRRSVAVLAASEARLQEARSRVALGSALRRTGSRSAAREELRHGRALAHRLGAHALTGQASAELALAGGRVARIEVTGLAALTAAERRVCELAASGLRNREIAQRLFVSAKTVEVHLSRAYRKLGVGRDDLAGALGGG